MRTSIDGGASLSPVPYGKLCGFFLTFTGLILNLVFSKLALKINDHTRGQYYITLLRVLSFITQQTELSKSSAIKQQTNELCYALFKWHEEQDAQILINHQLKLFILLT